MQNKILKGALVGTMVFSVLYELVALIGRFFLIRIAHLFTNIGLVYDIYNNVQNGLYGFTQLAFIIAGLALLLANRNSVSAVLGGGVLSLRALMLLSQAVLWCVYGILGNTAARNMIYPDWMSWTQIVLFVAAYCLIAMHYKSPVMLLLGIVAAVLKVVIQVLYTCFEHELMGMTAYVTVSGIFGILVFATGLIYLICWLRKTSQK
ncbi:MAG: hypothetical protein II140_01060 [Paludibacteraceae bacterium]|nr:hypothetical protein [Paludibacteraceae bacterium]MBQ2520284.1 hypothetical protein [Paludibacteraceae bacterium]MBQ5378928.1 hypothetical protein [Paludibacteraceae bacterium]